jgi:hypothetical protein
MALATVAVTTDSLRAVACIRFVLGWLWIVLIAAYLLQRHPMARNQVSDSKVYNTVQ